MQENPAGRSSSSSSKSHKSRDRPSSSSSSSSSPSPRHNKDIGEVNPLPIINKLDLSSYNVFEVRTLLWDQLEQKLNVVEWDEAKLIIGEDLVEKNKALKEENLALLSIWKDYSQATNTIEEQCQNDYQVAKSPLPERPHVRESLVIQIKFFICELSKSSIREAITSSREKAIYEYVTKGMPARPSTSSGGTRDKPTDIRPDSARPYFDSPPTSPGSPLTSAREEGAKDLEEEKMERGKKVIESKERMDVESVQAHVEEMRAILRHENQLLLKDSEFLQFCLDQQVDYNTQLQKYSKEKSDSSIPSLQEMTEFKSKLEQKYIEKGPKSEKEKSAPSSSRARPSPLLSSSSSSPSSSSPSSKPLRQSLPAPLTPSRTRTPSNSPSVLPPPGELKSSTNNSNNLHNDNVIHVPHPPKEQRPSDSLSRPRAKLSSVSLSPSSLSLASPSLSPSSSVSSIPPSSSTTLPPALPPSSSTSSVHSPSKSSSSASPKRTRLKQPT